MDFSVNIAIFGANGYIGRHLVHYISSSKPWSVSCFDIQEEFSGKENVEYCRIDITDKSQVSRCGEFDQIYFSSGLSGTSISFQRYAEFLRVNEMGLLNVLDHYKAESRKPKIIFPSSRLVYKGIAGKPLNEESQKECKTIYASSKYAGELYLDMYRNMYGFAHTVFRICVPYGQVVDGRLSYGTVGFFLESARGGKPIVLFGDGQLKRTFTHITDVCRQVVETAVLPESTGECFNVDGETFSLSEVAGLIAKKFGVPVQFAEWPATDLRLESGDTIFNAAKIRTLFPRTLTCSMRKWLSS